MKMKIVEVVLFKIAAWFIKQSKTDLQTGANTAKRHAWHKNTGLKHAKIIPLHQHITFCVPHYFNALDSEHQLNVCTKLTENHCFKQ